MSILSRSRRRAKDTGKEAGGALAEGLGKKPFSICSGANSLWEFARHVPTGITLENLAGSNTPIGVPFDWRPFRPPRFIFVK
jgi:hypothetical protein